MRILFLNQAFHPDVVASGQLLADLAVALVQRGHQVTVVTAASGYDDPARRFPRRENWKGIEIRRVPALRLGKQARWRRAIDFGSFLALTALRLALLRKHDLVVAMTSPPLISVLGAVYARARGARLVMWVLDLNPDEAIAAGWLRANSHPARALSALLNFSLRVAAHVVVMDRFMRDRLSGRAAEGKVRVIPPWTHDSEISFDEDARRRFRRRHGLDGKFVTMYAGNHSPCHPLDTLLQAARELRSDSSLVFVFVGGGSQVEKVRQFVTTNGLDNIVQLPYQPLDELGGMLSAADLHVVTLGDPFVGIVHPCKVYNILGVGRGVVYIGPRESHVTDLASQLPAGSIASFRHGDVTGVVAHIRDSSRRADDNGPLPPPSVGPAFARATVLPQLISLITDDGRRAGHAPEAQRAESVQNL